MKVGFTGTQIGMTNAQRRGIAGWLLTNGYQITEVHHGDCVGSDEQFHELVLLLPRTPTIYIHPPVLDAKRAHCEHQLDPHGCTPLNLRVFEPKHYIERNHDIVRATTHLLATPHSMREIKRSGSWATVRYAKGMDRHVAVCFPDGHWEFS